MGNRNGLKIINGNGITLKYGGTTISLDPKKPTDADVTFVSHAHEDHLHHPRKNSVILASRETIRLSFERGYKFGDAREEVDGLEMFDAGHILGSRGLLVGGEVFYTGDFASRPRAFLGKGRAVKCSTLIMEATFGRSIYRFPPVAEVVAKANRIISDLYSKGIPVVLMGHALGKAQVLTYLFSSWDPIYVNSAIGKLNHAHCDLGVDLRDDLMALEEAEDKGCLDRKPWVMIAPLRSGRSKFVQQLKKKYGVVTMAFSGWSCNPRYKDSMMLDYALPLSDHCDFNDLVELAGRCEPEKIYTVFGFASDFASHLKTIGYDASPLVGGQMSIKDYFEED
ncbi:MAG: exonuclease [Thaumarchaeota archaeon]|nr:exonuclease [Nitrososphaerota archaeon]